MSTHWHQPVILTGPTLVLALLRLADAPEFLAALGHEEVAAEVLESMSYGPPADVPAARAIIALADPDRLAYVQRIAGTGELVGTTSFYEINSAARSIAIGSGATAADGTRCSTRCSTPTGRQRSRGSRCHTAVVISVNRDDERSRYEGRLEDGELVTVIDFNRIGDVVDITYTGTKRRHRGRGFASSITQQALDDIRAEGWKVRPSCGFTATYLDDHPEYADVRV